MPTKREQRDERRASAEARRKSRLFGNLVVGLLVVGGLVLLWILTNQPAQPLASPAFGEQLSHEEIVAVIRYVQTWWTADQLASQQQASQQSPLQ